MRQGQEDLKMGWKFLVVGNGSKTVTAENLARTDPDCAIHLMDPERISNGFLEVG
jgi:hypothetical protein